MASLQISIERTRNLLGPIVKESPKLTDRLLVRPPVGFLQAIVISVVRETGFASGLFTEAELSRNAPKEDKLTFIIKLLSCVVRATNENIVSIVSPVKVGI
ncbi:unnamed protein product, partial [Choristocarpus tenellus]